eukprot:Colp12_sorted_trinity150504_noHs@15942
MRNRVAVVRRDLHSGVTGKFYKIKLGQARAATTIYSTLEKLPGQAALLSVQTPTNVKDQAQVHLADLLKTPIVGDTKYGAGIVAESLFYPEGQSADRKLHLVSWEIAVPDYFKSSRTIKPLIIRAPLPKFFKDSLKVSHMKAPKQKIA